MLCQGGLYSSGYVIRENMFCDYVIPFEARRAGHGPSTGGVTCTLYYTQP